MIGGRIATAVAAMIGPLCLAGVAWGQVGYVPPYGFSPQPYYYRPSLPPPQPRQPARRAKPKDPIKIPEPEIASISDQYPQGSNRERKLYFVQEPGNAVRYPVAIGSTGDAWVGVEPVTAKRENPTWHPTLDTQIELDVPPVVPPGPSNPLGPRALYLGDTLYRIHGTNRPSSIGGAVSRGCFRMFNPHIIELYEKVQIGANVYVLP